jgi:hypothetical protein
VVFISICGVEPITGNCAEYSMLGFGPGLIHCASNVLFLDPPTTMDQPDRPLIAAGVSFVLIAAAWAYSAMASRVRINEPPILPGSVPLLGHALAFGKDSGKLFTEAR